MGFDIVDNTRRPPLHPTTFLPQHQQLLSIPSTQHLGTSMSTTTNISNCDTPQVYQIKVTDPSIGYDASSEISTGFVGPKLLAGLPLPLELRLMVYAHLTKIVYRELPVHHRNAVFIYWPYIGMPSAPVCSSHQLHSDLQAYLAEVRLKSDVLDIIVRGHTSPVPMNLLLSISKVAKMDDMGD
jgi:hypothetical protein